MIMFEENLFAQLSEAIWLLADNKWHRTLAAKKLEESYRLDLAKIIAIAKGENTTSELVPEKKSNFFVVGEITPAGFPLILLDQDKNPHEFWGQVTFGKQATLLQITLQKASDNVNSLFGYLNDARESERKKIAKDLHDGIAQSIYSLMLETRGLKWITPEMQPEKLQAIDRHFAEVLEEVRDLAGELRPMSLDAFGLVPALEQFIARTEEMTGFEIDLTVTGEQASLSETVRTTLYRVVQEAVANAMKYAGVNQVQLTLTFQTFLTIEIVDYGRGFHLLQEKKGLGLMNMQERIYALNGSFSLVTEPNQGTKIKITVPLEHSAAAKN